MISGSSGTSWESLRKEARRLENEIDNKLVGYSKLVVSLSSASNSIHHTNHSVSSSNSTQKSSQNSVQSEGLTQRRHGQDGSSVASMTAGVEMMGIELEALLERLSEVVDSMSMSASTSSPELGTDQIMSSSVPQSPAFTHTLQRHREILSDYRNDFRRTKGILSTARERNEFFGGGSKMKNQSGNMNGSVSSSGNVGSVDALYAERAALMGSNVGVDSALDKGVSLRDELERQRQNFASMMERMEAASERLPAVNRIIGQIKRKKRRDVLILGVSIVALILFTLIWKAI
mmetsp:Transcript_6746/g.12059  ORF Transcript_6746/g.12059 Transcript_6746/m.12059 type:complete len:290 (-) Transcript_6746:1948-2817(-)